MASLRVIMLCLFSLCLLENAHAQYFGASVSGGSTLDPYLQLGASHTYDPNSSTPNIAPTVAITVTFPGQTPFTASGILAGPNTVVTAAHLFYDSNGVNQSSAATITVSTGPNFMTNPGIVMTGATPVICPGYIYSSSGPYVTPDIAKFTVNQTLNVMPLSSMTIPTLANGQTATSAGVGKMSWYGGPPPVQTGDVWGWNAFKPSGQGGNFDPNLFTQLDFAAFLNTPPLIGNGAGGSSGGGVYDPTTGIPLGLINFGSIDTTGSVSGYTGFERLDNPTVYNFASTAVVPEPKYIGILAGASLAVAPLLRRRRTKKDTLHFC